MYSDKSDRENDHDRDESDNDGLVESDTDTSERQDDSYIDPEPDHIKETIYLEEDSEELGEVTSYIFTSQYLNCKMSCFHFGFLSTIVIWYVHFRTSGKIDRIKLI